MKAAMSRDKKDNRSRKNAGQFGDYELLDRSAAVARVLYIVPAESLNRTVALKVIGLGHWATEAL